MIDQGAKHHVTHSTPAAAQNRATACSVGDLQTPSYTHKINLEDEVAGKLLFSYHTLTWFFHKVGAYTLPLRRYRSTMENLVHNVFRPNRMHPQISRQKHTPTQMKNKLSRLLRRARWRSSSLPQSSALRCAPPTPQRRSCALCLPW